MRSRIPMLILLAHLAAGCGGGAAVGDVAAVVMQATNVQPKVGETIHVGATPVDAHGVAVPGVACVFVSSAPGIAAVDASTGAVSALAPGAATITAWCPGPVGQGPSGAVDITVLPNQVKLTVTIQGTGTGSVFANPMGNGILSFGSAYDIGTAVTLTATASPGSVFMGWGGACGGTDPSCNLVMNADAAATATFILAEKFQTITDWSVDLGTVTDYLGCQYAVSASGNLTLSIVENAGAVTGTGTATAHVNIVTTYTPPYDTCTANPFDTTLTGDVTGNDAALAVALANPSGSGHFNFDGARNGATINGSGAFSFTLRDGSGNAYPTQGNTEGFVLNEQ